MDVPQKNAWLRKIQPGTLYIPGQNPKRWVRGADGTKIEEESGRYRTRLGKRCHQCAHW